MKNKWCILLIIIISAITLCNSGCSKKEYTKEELYEDFQTEISKITSYTCTAKVEAISNKEHAVYIFKNTYKKPDYYKLEIQSPENLKGKIIEYKDDKVIVYNPNNNDKVELQNINNNSHYLFIGDFIKNCMKNESVSLEVTENELKIEVEIPGDNKYFNKQILYVNNKTKIPDKMEILDNEQKAIFIVTYEDFKYEK